jgi:hypothetical protein
MTTLCPSTGATSLRRLSTQRHQPTRITTRPHTAEASVVAAGAVVVAAVAVGTPLTTCRTMAKVSIFA